MNIKRQLAAYAAAAMVLLAFTGCSDSQSAQLANEITVPLDSISDVTISYDEETVTFYACESDALTVKEYMTENKSSYYAKVAQRPGSIKISEGGKPLMKGGFSRYIEVYLPTSYHNNLTVTTTDGTIDIAALALSLNTLQIDSTAGAVQLDTAEAQNIRLSSTSGILDANCLDADAIRIDITSGSFSCEKLDGNVTYTTTSGNAAIQSAIGSGSYKAYNSGELYVRYTEVTGDLVFFNKNDSIQITLPADLAFAFEATTKNGSISTNFAEHVSTEGGTTSGTIGAHPTVTVKAETKNGDIDVQQESGYLPIS